MPDVAGTGGPTSRVFSPVRTGTTRPTPGRSPAGGRVRRVGGVAGP